MNETKRVAAEVTPIASHMELLVQLLKQASMVSRPMLEGVASPNAISLNELKIVMCLGGEGALAGHDISDIMGIPAMNVSRALAALKDRGWIEDAADPDNRRRRPVRLSAAGRKAYQQTLPAIEAVAEALLGGLTPRQQREFAALSDKIIAAMIEWIRSHHAEVKL